MVFNPIFDDEHRFIGELAEVKLGNTRRGLMAEFSLRFQAYLKGDEPVYETIRFRAWLDKAEKIKEQVNKGLFSKGDIIAVKAKYRTDPDGSVTFLATDANCICSAPSQTAATEDTPPGYSETEEELADASKGMEDFHKLFDEEHTEMMPKAEISPHQTSSPAAQQGVRRADPPKATEAPKPRTQPAHPVRNSYETGTVTSEREFEDVSERKEEQKTGFTPRKPLYSKKQ